LFERQGQSVISTLAAKSSWLGVRDSWLAGHDYPRLPQKSVNRGYQEFCWRCIGSDGQCFSWPWAVIYGLRAVTAKTR